MNILRVGALVLVLSLGVGCTEPGETTAVGAAAGGAIGAGLGAIVGNQTGDAGSGLAIGMLAGAGTGAAVGNALEAQEEAIRSQEEALERQERVIAKQRAEMEELRKMTQDQISYQGGTRGRAAPAAPAMNSNLYGADSGVAAQQRAAAPPAPAIEEKTLVASKRSDRALEAGYFAGSSTAPVQPEMGQPAQPGDSEQAMRGSYRWKEGSQQQAAADNAQAAAPVISSRGAPAPAMDNNPECQKAEKEIETAQLVNEVADKLFHYRRALRLCPSNPAYHNGLGEIYVSLQRSADAEYEFREALKLNPNYGPAVDNLQQLGGSGTRTY